MSIVTGMRDRAAAVDAGRVSLSVLPDLWGPLSQGLTRLLLRSLISYIVPVI